MMENSSEKAIDLIITQAQKLGFVCQITTEGKPIKNLEENWQLCELENRWLLSVKNFSQLYLSDTEVLKFLERQWERKFRK